MLRDYTLINATRGVIPMSEKYIQKMFPALGTVNSVTVYGEKGEEAPEQIKEMVLELHRRLSVFDPGSEISQINRMAGICPVAVSQSTVAILGLAAQYAARTEGAFDVTAGAMSGLWREAIRTHRLPDRADIARCRALCGIDGLELDSKGCTAFLRRRGMTLDLGGIAKGWAADEARRILTESGAERALINFGGTVLSVGGTVDAGIQDPFQRTGISFGHLPLCGKAAVTSGFNERYFVSGGKRYHHIIDPRTGKPSGSGLASVTLTGESAAALDALSTAIFILGAEKGLPLLRESGTDAVFITDSGIISVTPGLAGQFAIGA